VETTRAGPPARRLLAAWALSRLVLLALLCTGEQIVLGDLAYFEDSLATLGARGLEVTLVEYPLPAVLVLAVPWLLAQALGLIDPGLVESYVVLVVGAAVATDAVFTWLLSRSESRNRGFALGAWVAALPLLGALAYARFDILPGVLAAVALLLLGRQPRVAAGVAAVAAGVKLWPALLLPAMAASRRTRADVVAGAAVVGTVLAVGSWMAGGWDRLVSPLTWQLERGLQVESVAATPLMLAWALEPHAWTVSYSQFHAFEIAGPGAGVALAASTALGVAGLAVVATLWLRLWRQEAGGSPEAVAWTCLAAVTVLVVSSKVLSPQYLLWLLPMAAAALVVVRSEEAARRLRHWTVVLLAAAACTHLVFPLFYAGVMHPLEWSPAVVLVLALRNVLVIWLLGVAVREAWRAGAAARSREPIPERVAQ